MNLGTRDDSPPLPLSWLAVLAAVYLFSGTPWHDPWKAEDAIHLAIAYGFAQHGNWLVPAIAGEPWPHTAPLYHWIAALCGQLFGGGLGFHNAARLATTLCGAIFLVGISGAVRAFYGDAASRLAPLLALGTLGLLLPLHEAQPAVAGLAGAGLAWWGGGLVLRSETTRRGALLLGTGLGIAWLAHGLAGCVMAIGAWLVLAQRRDGKTFALALAVALPWLLLWPVLLHDVAPQLWASWWQNELAEAALARDWPRSRHVKEILINLWPLWPFALWSLWLYRRQAALLAAPALGALGALAWYLSGSPRTLSLLAVVPSFVLLAAAGAPRLRRGAANAFDWFALATFGSAAALVWLGASALSLGWPEQIAHNFEKLAPGHLTQYSPLALTFALAVTLVWLILWRLPKSPWRALLHWAAGITLMWALVATLWFSWLDHHKSYRSLVASLAAAVPAAIDCIERTNIGPAQRAVLDYFAGLRTVPPGSGNGCSWRLVIDDGRRAPPSGWTTVWQGGRLTDRRDKDERWYLERRGD